MAEMPMVVEISLPWGGNRREVRDNFTRQYSSLGQIFYDSDRGVTEKPTPESIQAALDDKSDFVVAVLVSNAYTVENELHAFIVTSGEGWKSLVGEMYMYPKVVVLVPRARVSYHLR